MLIYMYVTFHMRTNININVKEDNITFLKIEPLLYIKMLLIQKLSQVCIIWGIFVHKTKTLVVHLRAKSSSAWVDGTIPTDSVKMLTCQSGIKILISIQSYSRWIALPWGQFNHLHHLFNWSLPSFLEWLFPFI